MFTLSMSTIFYKPGFLKQVGIITIMVKILCVPGNQGLNFVQEARCRGFLGKDSHCTLECRGEFLFLCRTIEEDLLYTHAYSWNNGCQMHNMVYLVCIHTSGNLYGVETFENQVALEDGGTSGDHSLLRVALTIHKQKVN